MNNILRIKALKYPNLPHYEWEGEILQKTSDYVRVKCKPGRKLVHHTKNTVFTVDNTSLEYFSLKEWFTAAMEIYKGSVVCYYCNVAKPAILKNNKLTCVDVDLDVVQRKNTDWEVLDWEEVEENSIKYQYPTELEGEAVRALARLGNKGKMGEFPFNQQIIRWA